MGWRPGWPEIILILVVVVLLFGSQPHCQDRKRTGQRHPKFQGWIIRQKEEEQGSEKPRIRMKKNPESVDMTGTF